MNRPHALAYPVALLALAASLAGPGVLAQQGAPAAVAEGQAQAKTFSQQELDEILAPIALYPDSLFAQVLMASTYPLEIVQAARWQKAHPEVKGKALEDALQKQDWDPSVKSLTAVPQVLTMMSEKLDWTTKLGDAFLAQQEDLMKSAQKLRTKAMDAGTLKSTKEQTVKTEVENNTTVIKIEQPDPQVVHVPTYDPAVAYGAWPYPAPPPYYYYPPGYYAGTGLAFATGIVVGAAIWGNANWGGNNVNINNNNFNNFNKTNIGSGNSSFKHNAEHRKGAAYRDSGTASKYGRGGNSQAAQSRESFRGREGGGAQASQRSAGGSQVADRGGGGGASRGDGGGRGGGGASASQRSSGGFSGAGGGGASTRAASSRGGASRGGGGGGRGGGGRR